MSGTTIATNPYLQKLKTRDLSQPTKLTEPGFVSSVGYPRCHVFKNSASPKLGALRNVFTVLEHRCPAHVEPDRWQQAVEDGRRFLAQWDARLDAARPVRPAPGAGQAGPELPATLPLRRNRPLLAATRSAGGGAHRKYSRDRKADWHSYYIPPPQ